MKLSPQKEIIVQKLRDLKYHCGSEWLGMIKDDRIRISELNRGYMKEKGYVITGEPCRGRACGKTRCPLYMRRAEKLETSHSSYLTDCKNNVAFFDRYVPSV